MGNFSIFEKFGMETTLTYTFPFGLLFLLYQIKDIVAVLRNIKKAQIQL